jgi:hypothetical protein
VLLEGFDDSLEASGRVLRWREVSQRETRTKEPAWSEFSAKSWVRPVVTPPK